MSLEQEIDSNVSSESIRSPGKNSTKETNFKNKIY